MINVETILFIEKMRDLAKMSLDGFCPWSRIGDDVTGVVYDDSYVGTDGYPIIIGDKYLGKLDTYDDDESTFRVYENKNGEYYIIAKIRQSDEGFMIDNGQWFSL